MIANQLVTCEECRDASCRKCKAFIKRARARQAKKDKPVPRTVEQACADAMAEAAAVGIKLRSCKPF